jgi:hypothetical protein
VRFIEQIAVVLRQVAHNPHVLKQRDQVSDRANQVQVIGAIGLLNQLKFPVQPSRFLGHQIDLITGEPVRNRQRMPPAINVRNAGRLVRQQRRDGRLFPIRQFVSPPRHQASIATESLNHPSRQTSSLFMS